MGWRELAAAVYHARTKNECENLRSQLHHAKPFEGLAALCDALIWLAKEHGHDVDGDDWREFVQKAEQMNTKRSVANSTVEHFCFLESVWGADVAAYFRMQGANQYRWPQIRACATQFIRFQDFVLQANILVFERHVRAVRISRGRFIQEKDNLSRSDWNLLEHANPLSERDAAQWVEKISVWTTNTDGSILVGNTRKETLAKCTDGDFENRLLKFDDFGFLVCRSSAGSTVAANKGNVAKNPRSGTAGKAKSMAKDVPHATVKRTKSTAKKPTSTDGARTRQTKVASTSATRFRKGAAIEYGSRPSINPSQDGDIDDETMIPTSTRANVQTNTRIDGYGSNSDNNDSLSLSPSALLQPRESVGMATSSGTAEGSPFRSAFRQVMELHNSPTLTPASANDRKDSARATFKSSPQEEPSSGRYPLPETHAIPSQSPLMQMPPTRPSEPSSLTKMTIFRSAQYLTVGSALPEDADSTVEESRQAQFQGLLQNCLRQTQMESSQSAMCAIRAGWFTPETQLARIGERPSYSDVIRLCSSEFLRVAGVAGKPQKFDKPVLIKETFNDGQQHSVKQTLKMLNRTHPDLDIVVADVGEEKPRLMTVSELSEAVNQEMSGLRAADLPLERPATCPSLCHDDRFNLFDIVEARTRRSDPDGFKARSSSSDPTQMGFDGAFIPPHMDGYGGTWIRMLCGAQLWMFVPLAQMSGEELAAFEKDGTSWCPNGKQRAVLLVKDDVLFIPFCHIMSSYTILDSVFLQGSVWDDVETPSMCEYWDWARTHPQCVDREMGESALKVARELAAQREAESEGLRPNKRFRTM